MSIESNTQQNNQEIEFKKCPKFFNQIVVLTLLILTLAVSTYLNTTQNLKNLQYISYIVCSFGLSFFLSGIILPIIYKIKKYKNTTFGFGLYLISGFSVICWGILISFMNKV